MAGLCWTAGYRRLVPGAAVEGASVAEEEEEEDREEASVVAAEVSRCRPLPLVAVAIVLLIGKWILAMVPSRGPPPPGGQGSVSLASSARADADGDSASSASCFCFAVAMSSGGERALMEEHWAQKRHIFECPGYSFFSDTDLFAGLPVINIGPIDSAMGSWGSWANTGVFERAWRQVASDGIYAHFAWSLKVDPDTCFFPSRLASHVQGLDPEAPVYLKPPGILVGALEVFSVAAVRRFTDRGGEDPCEGDFGDAAEDGFVEFCMGQLGASSHKEADLLMSTLEPRGCAQPGFLAYHPMKDVESFAQCLRNATHGAETS